MVDLLWSDPHESEAISGFQHNHIRDPLKQNNIVSFGPDNLDAFLQRNNFSMLIRSHSICPDGIERFSDNMISITSCTNHSGVHNNDAVFVVIQKKFVVSPKIIKPLPNNQSNVHW